MTVLATADGDLEKAAKKEDLRVWNVEKHQILQILDCSPPSA
jgi:hypothetical protein